MLSQAFWEGLEIESCAVQADVSLLIRLREGVGCDPCCARCGSTSVLIHEHRRRRVRDRDCLDERVWLDVPLRRLDCYACGARATERMTHRLRAWVEALVQVLPIAHVAQLTGLHWHTVKRVDHRRLSRAHGAFDAGEVRRLVMDEFALHKGHRYATVIMDAERTPVLWIGEGNSREAIRPFFALLGERCAQIEAVAMDMNTAFDLEVRQHCAHAEVVYDLFHVVARYGREVIDRVRVDQANALRHDKPARKVVKGSRWLLLRNRENLADEQTVRLQERLAANQPLATVHVLKEALKQIWYAPSVREGWQPLAGLAPTGTRQPFATLTALRQKPQAHLRSILASAQFPMYTSLLEGVNNHIKVIKRMAYRFRDHEYFFLKIKAAFPGKAR